DRRELLGRAAEPVGAEQRDLALLALQLGVARGTVRRSLERRTLALLGDREDLRDDLAGLLEQHAVALAQPELRDDVPVVDRRAPDGGARQLDGVERRDRGDRAGPADVAMDVAQHGGDLAGRELVGDRPARELRGGAERGA